MVRYPAKDEVIAWFDAANDALARSAKPWPAAWGGQFRVGDGEYVTESDFYEIVEPSRLDLWYSLLAADGDDALLDETVRHRHDAEWLQECAGLYVDGDAEQFWTEAYPNDFTDEELAEMVGERPDLFGPEDRASWPRLAHAARGEAPGRYRLLESGDGRGLFLEEGTGAFVTVAKDPDWGFGSLMDPGASETPETLYVDDTLRDAYGRLSGAARERFWIPGASAGDVLLACPGLAVERAEGIARDVNLALAGSPELSGIIASKVGEAVALERPPVRDNGAVGTEDILAAIRNRREGNESAPAPGSNAIHEQAEQGPAVASISLDADYLMWLYRRTHDITPESAALICENIRSHLNDVVAWEYDSMDLDKLVEQFCQRLPEDRPDHDRQTAPKGPRLK